MRHPLAPLTGLLILLACLAAPAGAAGPIRLQAAYAKGEHWVLTIREEDVSTLTAQVPRQTSQTSRMLKEVTARWEVAEILPNGDARITMRYENFVGGLFRDGALVAGLDSRVPQQPEAVRQFLTVMRRPFSLTVSRRATIVAVAGLDEILDEWRSDAEQRLSVEKRAELDWLVEALLGSENVSKTLSEALTPLPAGPVDMGAEWSEPLELRSEFGTFKATRSYRLAPHAALPEWFVVSEASRFALTPTAQDLEVEFTRGSGSSTSYIHRDSGRLAWKRSVVHMDFDLYGVAANQPRTLLQRSQGTVTTTIAIRPVLVPPVRAHLEQGRAFIKARQLDAAVREFDRAVALQPAAPEPWSDRGMGRHARRDLTGALADYDQAIRLDPGFDEAYQGRAAVRVDLNDNAGAIQDHSSVIQLRPEGWRSYFLRGILHSLAGQWPLTIRDLTSAIERNPDVPEAYRFRADAYRQAGNRAAAEADHLRWLELAGSRPAPPGVGPDLSPLIRLLRDLGRDDGMKAPLMRLLGVEAPADPYPARVIAVTVSREPQRLKLLFIPRPEGAGGEVMLGGLDGDDGAMYRATADGRLKAAVSVPPRGEARALRIEDAADAFRREARWWLEREAALREALRQPSSEPGELCQTGEKRFAPCAE